MTHLRQHDNFCHENPSSRAPRMRVGSALVHSLLAVSTFQSRAPRWVHVSPAAKTWQAVLRPRPLNSSERGRGGCGLRFPVNARGFVRVVYDGVRSWRSNQASGKPSRQIQSRERSFPTVHRKTASPSSRALCGRARPPFISPTRPTSASAPPSSGYPAIVSPRSMPASSFSMKSGRADRATD